MGPIQAWLPEGVNLAGLAAFLAAMVVSFLAGYLAGRSARPAPARRTAPRQPRAEAEPRDADPLRPLPVMGTDEARLMDLTAIRRAEAEPPPPIKAAPRAPDAPGIEALEAVGELPPRELTPPFPGAPTSRDASDASSDQLRLPMAGRRLGPIPRQRPMRRPDRNPA